MVKASHTESTIKFLCSYGGMIVPRHIDGKLRYVDGLTRVLAVDRSISFTELMVKLVEFCGSSVVFKCQLPNGDLETLISVKSDEDLANIIEEYDRSSLCLPHPLKIRCVLSPPKSLKTVSPPLSRVPSVPSHMDSSVDKLPYIGRCYSPPIGYPVKIQSDGKRSPPVGYPVGVEKIHSYPRNPYRVHHCNHWQ